MTLGDRIRKRRGHVLGAFALGQLVSAIAAGFLPATAPQAA